MVHAVVTDTNLAVDELFIDHLPHCQGGVRTGVDSYLYETACESIEHGDIVSA